MRLEICDSTKIRGRSHSCDQMLPGCNACGDKTGDFRHAGDITGANLINRETRLTDA